MPQLQEKIYQEQIRLIYGQGPVLVLGATACAAIISLFLWFDANSIAMQYWLAVLSLSALLRLWGISKYTKSALLERRWRGWGPLFWVGTLSAGIMWGAWPILFYQNYSTESLLFISTIVAGMTAVSAASGSVYVASFFTFSVPMVIPLAVLHMQNMNTSLQVTGVLLFMFLIVCGMLAVRSNRQYRELIQARFENLQLMERLAIEKRNAEQAVVAKSRFLAAASHDLRQPLHAMSLFLAALRNQTQGEKQLAIVADLSKSTEALNSLLNSLLDVSRLDAEIIQVNNKHVAIQPLLDSLRSQFTHVATEKNVQLKIGSCDDVIITDALLLERVLRNLLSNALQYTYTGEICLSCYQRCSDQGVDELCICLTDTGIGIPEAELENVFSEYHQLNNPERNRRKGLGLGLAIVKRLCVLMSIPMQLQSKVGEGTVFELSVPLGHCVEMALPMPHIDEQEHSVLGLGCVVLAIDDEQQVLEGMRHMLESCGCVVILALSTKQALKRLSLSSLIPDVVVSDYRLSEGQNGIDAVTAVMEFLERKIPAIIVSGDTSPERLREVSESNLQMLHKPVSAPELLGALKRVLVTQGDSAARQVQCSATS